MIRGRARSAILAVGFAWVAALGPGGARLAWSADSMVFRAHCLGLKLQALENEPEPGKLDERRRAPAFELVSPTPNAEAKRIEFPPGTPGAHGLLAIELGKPLGAGGYGTVYRVKLHYRGGRTEAAAMKVPFGRRQQLVAEESAFRRIREAADAHRLSYLHPIVGKVTWGGRAGKTGYISPLAGVSVYDIRGDLTLRPNLSSEGSRKALRRIALMAHDLLEALGELGRAGIVHRDIKGENTLFSGGGDDPLPGLDSGELRLKLIDFGTSIGSGAELFGTAGTPGYIDPASRHPAGRAEPLSDLYSVGAMLTERLLGLDAYPGPVALPLEKRPHLEFGDTRIVATAYLNKGYVMEQLRLKRRQLLEGGMAERDLGLFDDLAEIIEVAIEPDIEKRRHLAREDQGVNLRLQSKGGVTYVSGAGEVFKTRIREAMGAGPEAGDTGAPREHVTPAEDGRLRRWLNRILW